MKTINDKKQLALSTIVCLLPIVMYLLVYDRLPEQMVQQWGAGGTPNWTMARPFAIVVVPVFLAIIHVIVVLALNSKHSVQKNPPKFRVLMSWFVPVTSIFTNLLVLFANIDESFDVGTAVLVFVGVVFIVMGNYLPKLRQNYVAGIRTPWTLKNADNWYKTHRLGGKVFVFAGVIFILTVVLPLSANGFVIAVVFTALVAAIVPIAYSYVIYKKS